MLWSRGGWFVTKGSWLSALGWSRVEIIGEVIVYREPKICTNMPVRRGHVAPQNTFLGTIIRKFEGQSKFSLSFSLFWYNSLGLLRTRCIAAPDCFKFVGWKGKTGGEEGIPKSLADIITDLHYSFQFPLILGGSFNYWLYYILCCSYCTYISAVQHIIQWGCLCNIQGKHC